MSLNYKDYNFQNGSAILEEMELFGWKEEDAALRSEVRTLVPYSAFPLDHDA